MAFLELRNLSKSIGGIHILKGIDITLDKGGFLVLVGPSGCGKSTLLNTVAGLTPVTKGEIVIDGEVVNDLHPSKRDIAMVFQSYALYPNMTVEGNIAFALEMRGVPRAEREEAVRATAKLLQIEHLLKRRPSQLSGGQRQRVAMGRALVRKPRVFLFDEPLSNLDAKLRVEMRAEIKRLHRDTGATIVYVTHDQIEAMTMATKIAVLKEGVVQQVGTPGEIYSAPANLFVADFMGSPAMNLLEGRVVANGAGRKIELSGEGSDPVRVALPPTRGALDEGRQVILGIRPEAITDRGLTDPDAKVVDTIHSVVDIVEPTGSDTYVVSQLAGKEITARVRSDATAEPGQPFAFVLNMDKAVLFDPETTERIV
ncbi:sn-glycerol-3-phosphate ABC transporter ATP-binding protein UgpC [Chelativorans sp. M5D2P16]|uniref:ABC transporter ATP-binding protein n=1 Tax=Chelativorans sp. M5D2P16 TaxID=3095678 RepID=UPI002ACA28A6|nr:sn-glycerol-3-phosphate ABC transporter ATP-binding protein UgpC [Chelativorans sp. M5D2P16]MDZ5695995.1 sn-glycerol-3-phosphate ABC transporter ATP-binding protein UgpC [Chelativorans sp. M5D2P16]